MEYLSNPPNLYDGTHVTCRVTVDVHVFTGYLQLAVVVVVVTLYTLILIRS